MAELLLTFAVEGVLSKVVKVAAEQIGLAWGLEKELEELKKWLLNTEAFLRDINTRKLHHDSVRLWVDELQSLVHEAEDLLDELVYEDLRRKVQKGKLKKKVRDFASSSNNPFVFRVKMANRMKDVTNLLCKHYHEAGPLGLVSSTSPKTEIDISQLRETVSELDDFEVVGRDVEVSSIVNQMIVASDRHVTSILPIVGMGGLGKTTLAKLIFNHERIKQHFDKAVWVCVSEPFDINKILGAILHNLESYHSSACDNREVLLCKLKKEMHEKRYFLVLDDIWNENSSLWDELKNCLMRITEKSENSILVTTRSVEVAKIMETLPSHHLSKLSDDQCWSLFQESANANELLSTSSLKVVREGLVKKIGGIPLVAKVWGRAVKFEGNFDKWATVLESEIRSPFQEESFALYILKLSVDRLPSFSLKQCFAYCSNFPKDFVFNKEQLIQMWMAQGFIHLQEGRRNKTMEDEGDRYFKILLSRCLFQDVVKDDRGRIISCKMHDVIHDIACDVSNDHKLQLDDSSNLLDGELLTNENQKIANKLRTLIYYEKRYKSSIMYEYQMIPHKLEKVSHDKMMNFVCLRVLIMNSGFIYELPDSIGKLKHLRYLDISSCSIKRLPKSIGLLYNLQTLRMKESNIVDLPENLRKLVSLRHLQFSLNIFLAEEMPPYLSQLIQLQTLPYFLVGFKNGCKITELGPLKDLKGSLDLHYLDRVESKEEAKSAKLVEKENLHELTFLWSFHDDRKDKENHKDFEVLEGLQPPKNLQTLKIESFLGECFPNNIFVENLVAISLSSCPNCERLPMLGQLPNLEDLHISWLCKIQSIGNEFYGINDSNKKTLFPKLKKFRLEQMRSLVRWEQVTDASNVTTFPHLEDLRIFWCTKLLNIPNIFGCCDENGDEHLKIVAIGDCEQLGQLPSGLKFCHSIQHLCIMHSSCLALNLENREMVSSLRIMLPQKLAHLKIKIYGKHRDDGTHVELKLVDELEIASEDGWIEDSGGIQTLPEWLENLMSLQTLRLTYFINLRNEC